MRQTILILLLAAAAAVGGFFAYRVLLGNDARNSVIGRLAPEITLTDLDGQARKPLTEFQGKWILLNFWASWCAPCIDELPHLVEAQSLYGARGLQIVGPALDGADSVRPMVARFRISYPVMPDYAGADAVMNALGNDKGALPYSVLIGPDGRIAETVLGAMSREQLAALVARHLGR
jgi:thiol-disulfide isomerase/thioredoxin